MTVPAATTVLGVEAPSLLAHLGLRVSPAQTAGPVVIEVDPRPDLVNAAGMLQGGVVATLIDVAGGVAAARASSTRTVFTSDLTVHYLAAGRVGPVRAVADVLRRGDRAVVVEVRVLDAGAADRLMAVAVMTLTLGQPRPKAA